MTLTIYIKFVVIKPKQLFAIFFFDSSNSQHLPCKASVSMQNIFFLH